jgi:hypothetical protein
MNTQERKAKIVSQTEWASKGTTNQRQERRELAEGMLTEGLSEANAAAYEAAHLALIREFADKID